MALAISYAEDGNRACDRINVNSNKTIDVGLFQLNSVHGYPITSMIDCRTNVDLAYSLFKTQGWNPWVTYHTQAYKKYLSTVDNIIAQK